MIRRWLYNTFRRCNARHALYGDRCARRRGHEREHVGTYKGRIHAWVAFVAND